MNKTEAITLCRFVKACCPQQTLDEYTPDAWAMLLDDVRFNDAREAVTDLAKRQNFISPAEIRLTVANIRRDRLNHAPDYQPPPGLTDAEYIGWLKQTRRLIADGEPVTDYAHELPARNVKALVAGAFHRP